MWNVHGCPFRLPCPCDRLNREKKIKKHSVSCNIVLILMITSLMWQFVYFIFKQGYIQKAWKFAKPEHISLHLTLLDLRIWKPFFQDWIIFHHWHIQRIRFKLCLSWVTNVEAHKRSRGNLNSKLVNLWNLIIYKIISSQVIFLSLGFTCQHYIFSRRSTKKKKTDRCQLFVLLFP